MRYAVIGAAGQLGSDLCPRLRGEVIPLGRDRAELTRPDLVEKTLTMWRPNVVINCAAYNLVDKAEAEPNAAFAVNSEGVRNLGQICRKLGAMVVHFSTDYVFGQDLTRNTPYRESDRPGPVSAYGTSKLTGEAHLRSATPHHLIIRTCGLYGVSGSGGKGGNFVETMLRLAAQGRDIRVVTDQTCTPTYTVDLVAATIALMEAGATGLFHITNSASCTWFEFARTIFEIAGVKPNLTPVTSVEYGAAATRPGYSVLANSRYEGLNLPVMRPWQDALAAYVRERQNRQP